ncbi:MAG: PIG-L family deacetylase [Clostridiales bacterium]|jgi:LmbE family N-acetylglucosaminyl deacetylase|nr:PIG-L family deacetylase [Clostridiales bacterium]
MFVFVPEGTDEKTALERTTHLAISAHQDDIEIMAYDGIVKCFGSAEHHFTGVVVTNGSGSPRSGIYAGYTDEEMREIRKKEQCKAAVVGEYSAQVFLDYTSGDVKNPRGAEVVNALKEVIERTKPRYIYTHNLADKHDTHVGVAVKVIQALRALRYVPDGVYGCEVWRSLDWLSDGDKVTFDVAGHANLEAAVLGVFDSQIAGGKRYDLATVGRRLANATYFESHGVDGTASLMYAMDLTPLARDAGANLAEYVLAYIGDFAKDVERKIGGLL